MSSPSGLPFSKTRHAGDLVYLAGEMPISADGSVPEGIEAQTHLTLDRIAATLAERGLGLNNVVSVLVHLTDPQDFPAFNRAYADRFEPPYPVRTTVRADLMLPGAKLELTAIAQTRA